MAASSFPDTPYIHVLYTGGTIGMKQTAEGLAPAAGFEHAARKAQALRADDDQFPVWTMEELEPLIDSANMTPVQWQRLVDKSLEAVRQGATGLLVLHGTDTLAYTAGALSFLLAGLSIPVVVTGSMLPAGVEGSDAWENFFDSLKAFHSLQAPSLMVQFHGQQIPGVACRKVASHGRHAFQSAFALFSTRSSVGLDHESSDEVVNKRWLNTSFGSISDLPRELQVSASRHLARVAIVELFPGITARQLEAFLTDADGVVLECYGSGTAPSDDDELFAVIERATEQGILIVAITLCLQGGVSLGNYAAGSRLSRAGVLSGGAMTREAALGKLHWLLGSELDKTEQRIWVERDVIGERNEDGFCGGRCC